MPSLMHKLLLFSGGGAPAISVSPASWDAGSTPVGTPVSQEFTIENTGTGTLLITLSITTPDGFTVTVDPATSVAPGASTTFTLRADAGSVAVFSGNISIVSNAATSPTVIAVTVEIIPVFVFRDEFITNEAAPIATPRTAEPTGTSVVVQNDGQMSIATNYLNIPAQGSPASGDLGMYSNSNIARSLGLALFNLVRFTTLANSYGVCFGAGNAATEFDHRWSRSNGHEIFDGSLLQRVGGDFITNSDFVLSIILKTVGAYYIKDEELIAVGYSGNLANVRAKLFNLDAVWKSDYERVANVASVFNPDTLAISKIASPAVGQTVASGQDCHEYIQWTVGSGETFELLFRRVDDDNCLIFRCSQSGSTAKLIKRAGGVETELNSVARTWTIATTYRLGLRYIGKKIYGHAVNTAFLFDGGNAYNSEIAGSKVRGFATAANWEIYPAILPDAVMDELAKVSNPFMAGSGRSKQVIAVADGGDIQAAIATMRAGDTLSLATNGNYTLAGGVNGFSALPNGFWAHKTTVLGNNATITGGDISLSLTDKKHIHFENLNLIDGVTRSVLCTRCRWLTFDNIYASSNVNATYFDVFRFVESRNILVENSEAAPSTGWGEHDGFECTDQCGDITFSNCVAHGVIHGFEVWSGTLAAFVWKNYNITFLNCHSYDNEVGYSSEGGSQALAQVEIVADGCTAATNSEFDYQGIDGATLYIENNTGGTTNGSVTIRS